jgi:hypothetical protein
MKGPTIEFGEEVWARRMVCSIWSSGDQKERRRVGGSRDLQKVEGLAADVVLRHAHEVALVVEAGPVVAAADDRMDHNDIEDVAEEDHTAVVIQRQEIDQLEGGMREGEESGGGEGDKGAPGVGWFGFQMNGRLTRLPELLGEHP